MIHLSPRLAAVAKLVPAEARPIDVGTDHAMVPVWLIQSGRCEQVLATDIRSGPLKSARALLMKTGTADCILLTQTDGLHGIGPADGDTVILAGMGGETMIAILAAAPWTKEKGTLLILEPQSKKADLRRWLRDNGYGVLSEQLVRDAGRIYPILTARRGESRSYTEAELHLGLLDQVCSDPLFGEYLDMMCAQAEKAAPYDEAAAALVEEYDEIKRRLSHDDGR